jgi:hypothetical protein
MVRSLQARSKGQLGIREVATELGLSMSQVRYRIRLEVLPSPDICSKHSCWVFSPEWVTKAKDILK